MGETGIWLIVTIVCGGLYYFNRYFDMNLHLSGVKLNTMNRSDQEIMCKAMIEVLADEEGFDTLPKFKFANLSKIKAAYGDNMRLSGFYDYGLKMIMIDVDYLSECGDTVKDMANLISHEWQHYVDHLNGITYDTHGVEICEARANRFEKKGSRIICKSLV